MPPPPRLAPFAVIAMGVSGSGKSTLGALLARRLDCPFLEGDDFHDARAVAKMSAGQPLDDSDRWPWLDRLGLAAGEAVACGGRVVAACSALKRGYRERLRAAIGANTRFVLLDAGQDELLRRLTQRSGHYMPASLLDSQLATLERPGPDEAIFTLDTTAPPERLCDHTLAWLESDAHHAGAVVRASGH
ncbi:gluconokinase [Caulobacter sp. BK020]|uniref:gluconokinase n=1 Tax=Caulobacter sp. BK020 TaxID=2512117 RepID=UPI0010F0B204|nr:gluconokinase [Caulobacter sp. BK020]TCS10013.1 gluconokinase [Caulobacter sp. BK020]